MSKAVKEPIATIIHVACPIVVLAASNCQLLSKRQVWLKMLMVGRVDGLLTERPSINQAERERVEKTWGAASQSQNHSPPRPNPVSYATSLRPECTHAAFITFESQLAPYHLGPLKLNSGPRSQFHCVFSLFPSNQGPI